MIFETLFTKCKVNIHDRQMNGQVEARKEERKKRKERR